MYEEWKENILILQAALVSFQNIHTQSISRQHRFAFWEPRI